MLIEVVDRVQHGVDERTTPVPRLVPAVVLWATRKARSSRDGRDQRHGLLADLAQEVRRAAAPGMHGEPSIRLPCLHWGPASSPSSSADRSGGVRRHMQTICPAEVGRDWSAHQLTGTLARRSARPSDQSGQPPTGRRSGSAQSRRSTLVIWPAHLRRACEGVEALLPLSRRLPWSGFGVLPRLHLDQGGRMPLSRCAGVRKGCWCRAEGTSMKVCTVPAGAPRDWVRPPELAYRAHHRKQAEVAGVCPLPLMPEVGIRRAASRFLGHPMTPREGGGTRSYSANRGETGVDCGRERTGADRRSSSRPAGCRGRTEMSASSLPSMTTLLSGSRLVSWRSTLVPTPRLIDRLVGDDVAVSWPWDTANRRH